MLCWFQKYHLLCLMLQGFFVKFAFDIAVAVHLERRDLIFLLKDSTTSS